MTNGYAAEDRFVKNCIRDNSYIITNHAMLRMFERKIKLDEVIDVILNGTIVEIDTRRNNPRLVYNQGENNAVVEVDMPSKCILITVEKVDWSIWEKNSSGSIKRK